MYKSGEKTRTLFQLLTMIYTTDVRKGWSLRCQFPARLIYFLLCSESIQDLSCKTTSLPSSESNNSYIWKCNCWQIKYIFSMYLILMNHGIHLLIIIILYDHTVDRKRLEKEQIRLICKSKCPVLKINKQQQPW